MKKILGIFAAFLFLNIGMVFASEIPANFCFNLNLEEGDQGEDVKYLQVLLNRDSETQIAESGAGSPQNETNYFGALTKKAVIKFQEKHFDDILKPWGFKNGTGIVGATTRAKLNGFFSKEVLLPQDIQISDLTPFQGETLIIKINNVREGEKITAEFNNNDFEFYPINSDIEEIVVLPISAKAQIGKHPLTIKSNLRASFSTVIKVKGVNFKVTNLTVTNNLSQKGYNANSIQKNVANENELIYSKVLNEPVTQFLFTNKFVYPLGKVVNVGAYGNIRKSGNVSLQHLGVDLDAKEGTSVYAINDGVVKFTREMNDYGKMMIIDHGGGIRSFYLHLNEFLKSEGESVKRGEVIAYSGNTGYSIEPHLHLSINVYGNSIDPLYFLEIVNENL